MLHELVTHTVTPGETQHVTTYQDKCGKEGEDESTVENFNTVAREAYLSPRAGDMSGKKRRKNGKLKDIPQSKRILPRRAASQNK